MITVYDTLIRTACYRYLPAHIDWRLFKAQLYQESRLNSKAVSPAGAKGIAQFLDATWLEQSAKAGRAGASVWNPEDAIFVGARYMADILDEWTEPRPDLDRYCLALLSYNAGLRHVVTAQKLANGSVMYADIIKALPNVPKVSAIRAKEGAGYVKHILGFWADQVTGP